MVQISWLLWGAVIVGAAVRAGHSARAQRIGYLALGGLYLLSGALVHVVYLARGDDYAEFGQMSQLAFVRDTWASLVVPNHHFFIGLLILFEAAVGVGALLGGRWARLAALAAIAFNVAVVSFTFWFVFWSVPIVAALARLLTVRPVSATATPPSGRAAVPAHR